MSAGRPKIAHDPQMAEKIQSMRQYGATLENVADVTGLSIPTLRKLYGRELAAGESMANIAVGKKLFERCMAGDVAALIFWAKTRMGWREKEAPGVEVNIVNQQKAISQARQQIQETYGLDELP